MATGGERVHPSVDLTKAAKVIQKMHDQVSGGQRYHITRADNEDVCVMISRKELESLESAMAIFADTDAFAEMCKGLTALLKSADVVYDPVHPA